MIREATLDDVDGILDLGNEFFVSSSWSVYIEWEGMLLREVVRTMITDARFIAIVAEINGELVGMLGAEIGPLGLSSTVVAQERCWFVTNAHRLGVGHKLVLKLEALAKAKGAEYTMLARLESSPEGIDDYFDKTGYSPIEHTYIKRI